MSLHIASLNSGSNGNCYYLGNDHDAVLIDAGISSRETVKRMKRLGLIIGRVRAIFISHEHTDHTRGAEVLSRRHGIPVFITPDTLQKGRLQISKQLLRHFSAHRPVRLGTLRVHPFPKNHDGIDPHSFTVESEGFTAGVFTDIGSPCEHVLSQIKRCHALFLESNYDEQMLEKGRYPLHLKRRIRGDLGHLSNLQALEIYLRYCSPSLKLLILSHLSAENNDPSLVSELFRRNARNGVRIEVASRYRESEVFSLPEKIKEKASQLKLSL